MRRTDIDLEIEPERYELFENIENLETTRREFFRIAGGGVIIAMLLGDDAIAQRPGRTGGPQEIGAWVHVGEDSTITAYSGKVEIGQNVRTSLSQVVAEELRVPLKSVRMVMADTALVPPDAGTFGSQSTRQMGGQLRRAAAAAREALVDLAAEKAKVERATLTVVEGRVAGPDGKPSFSFGELTKGQKLLKVIAAGAPTAKADDWKVAGTSAPKVDGRDFVTGSHAYASDIRRPGMVFGRILRAPAYGAKLKNVDTKPAEGVAGVNVVHEKDFVGVTASTAHEATAALTKIKADWQTTPQVAGKDLFKHLKEKSGRGGGKGGFGGGGGGSQGNIETGLKAADQTLKATYTIAYIAHVPLEPRAAVAEWVDGKLTVWTGTQRPFGVKTDLANALGVAADKVRVIVPDMGSGYGGKHTGEAAIETARLAKAVGKPVKVVWTREEEFTWAYFRPAGVIDVIAGAAKDGTLTAWEFHNYNSGGSAIRTPYSVANVKTEAHGSESPLRHGSYRALASTANVFARESAMDELAAALKMDPLEFRLKNLKDARLRAVFEAAAKKFGWGAKPQAGHGFGIGGGTEKGSFVATCAEVAIDKEKVRVIRAVTAFECGAVVNPDHLTNQIEGAVIMGLGGALFERVDFDEGKILNPAFSGYRVPRFRDAPVLETVLVNRKDLPSEGAGETPIISIAPAIGNAIFQATGIRVRSMPLAPEGLKAG
ncbi:MAG TPA: molybdopterin cofactor-binding domain-containing protein [Gemmataceae bacterium]|jgi:isoquinoline 1-oxidoreductase|nr:molybdopterin cofactor-binding domain-containing protein [Gemmataceae bacterium]